MFKHPAAGRTSSFTPFFPNGAGGVVIAMGLTFIAFEGYDLIATVAEEIKAPEKTQCCIEKMAKGWQTLMGVEAIPH
jgi:amino acid transporter